MADPSAPVQSGNGPGEQPVEAPWIWTLGTVLAVLTIGALVVLWNRWPACDTPVPLLLSAVSPAAGLENAKRSIAVNGSGFEATTKVFVDGELVPAIRESGTVIIATVPARPAGAVDIVAANGDCQRVALRGA